MNAFPNVAAFETALATLPRRMTRPAPPRPRGKGS